MNIGSHEVKVLDKNTVVVGCQRVTYQQVLAVRDLMDRYVESPPFKAGDFVRVVKTPGIDVGDELFVGKYGKIVSSQYSRKFGEPQNFDVIHKFKVEFSEPIGKILNRETGCDHHWWLDGDNLKLADLS